MSWRSSNDEARRAVSQDQLWVGYTFPLRAGVHIGCEQRSGRTISFGSGDIQFRIEPQLDEVDNEPCDDRAAAEVVLAALDPSHAFELRESAVFWASQVGGEEGLQRLLDVARNDANAEVRMASIFWLGQVAGERATVDLAEIAEDDPNTEVRQSADSRAVELFEQLIFGGR